MLLLDVNVLIYSHREESQDHAAYRGWLDSLINGDEAYGVSSAVLSAVVRITTHPGIYRTPTPLEAALAFASEVRQPSHCVPVEPGPLHWDIFVRLCRAAGARGSLVSDAYLAALAIESGSEWVTTDRDFGRFPVLRWRHPLR